MNKKSIDRNSEEEDVQRILGELIDWSDDIAGEWNGDLPGLQEDRAHIANEISDKAKEIKDLLEGLEEL